MHNAQRGDYFVVEYLYVACAGKGEDYYALKEIKAVVYVRDGRMRELLPLLSRIKGEGETGL